MPISWSSVAQTTLLPKKRLQMLVELWNQLKDPVSKRDSPTHAFQVPTSEMPLTDRCKNSDGNFPDTELSPMWLLASTGTGRDLGEYWMTALMDCSRRLLSFIGMFFFSVDCLAHFGTELLDYFFKKTHVWFVVVGKGDTVGAQNDEALQAVIDPLQELADDLITVTSFFMACHNGLHSVAHQRAQLRSTSSNPTMGQGVRGQAEECLEEEEDATSQVEEEGRDKDIRRGNSPARKCQRTNRNRRD